MRLTERRTRKTRRTRMRRTSDGNVARKKHIDAILFGTREDIDDCWATIQMIERMIAERSE